jgi:hypothetical protein
MRCRGRVICIIISDVGQELESRDMIPIALSSRRDILDFARESVNSLRLKINTVFLGFR